MTSRLSARRLTVSLAGLAVAGLAGAGFAAQPASAETRGFVIDWFMGASYSQDGDCVGGPNPNKEEMFDVELLQAGHTKEQIEAWNKDPDKYGKEKDEAISNLCKIDGKPVSCAVNPATLPDPHLHPIGGKFAYGFNLDGKGAASPLGFEEPNTHEQGINNQLFRATGCYGQFRSGPEGRTAGWQNSWEMVRNGMPAWLLSVSGADLTKDGDATVTFDRALEHVERDAADNLERDITYRIDPDPRSHASFPAKIKDGVVTITEHGDLHAIFGEEMFMAELRLRNTHFRLTLKPDGTVEGMLGGYQPWVDLYAGVTENLETNLPALYWMLRKSADANPDPKTGENTDISVAYRIEAIPAFLLTPSGDSKTAQAGQ